MIKMKNNLKINKFYNKRKKKIKRMNKLIDSLKKTNFYKIRK